MEQKSTPVDELIISCLSGNLDPAGKAELKERLDASPENRACLRTMRKIWLASGAVNHAGRFDRQRAFKRFLIRTGNRRQPARHLVVMRRIGYVAAAVALLLTVSYVSFRQGGEQVKNRFADIVVEAPLGAKTKMILPDGTLVWLNAGSGITYSQGFGVSDRNIRLTGEGYFEVTENAALPFLVKTDELQVSVLGTKFNFSNYSDNEEAIVSLIEGKVDIINLMKINEEQRLFPDEKVFLNKKTGQMRVSRHKTQLTTGWTNGYLFFDDELLPDIVKALERNYNVKIRIADKSLESTRFYSEFSFREQTIESVLSLLKSTHKLTYTVKGKEIVLHAHK
jgi:ferric-dicitrate binding protein FerR (iron transport regulator)